MASLYHLAGEGPTGDEHAHSAAAHCGRCEYSAYGPAHVISRGAAAECSRGREPWGNVVATLESPGGAEEGSASALAPLRGFGRWSSSQGSRPGLHSCAAPRLRTGGTGVSMAKREQTSSPTLKRRADLKRVNAGTNTRTTLGSFWDTESFLVLSDAEKEKVWRSLNREISAEETRPLSPAQRRQWARIKRQGR